MSAVAILVAERSILPEMANHLWQSTLYLLGAGIVIAALRKQQARIRYGLWLSATAKFLIPFTVFMGLGRWFAHFRQAPPQQAGFASAVQYVSGSLFPADRLMPRAANGLLAWVPLAGCLLWLLGSAVVLAQYIIRWRAVCVARDMAARVREGKEFDALQRAMHSTAVGRPIGLLLCEGTVEPGIVGVRQPELLWPVGITEHLDDAQLDAIMLHEACHVRRHDNLTAMLQMAVEVVFWFHPLVWWLGSRLISERERACDEAVLQIGSDPRVYAESILKASKFCVESPLTCVAGVTGSDLKQRMVRIMTQKRRINLGLGSKILLWTLGIAVVAAPVLSGAFGNHAVLAAADIATPANVEPLKTATIKPSQSTEKTDRLKFHNGDLTFANVTVRQMILYAYGLKDYQLADAPAWTGTERYDVAATWQPSNKRIAPGVTAPQPPPPPPGSMVKRPLGPLEPIVPLEHGQLESIIKSVLATRFGLQMNGEPKNLSGFAIEAVPGGTKLPKPIAPTLASDGEPIFTVREASQNGVQELGTVGPLRNFADQLSEKVGAPVADRTGLPGTYDITLYWTAGENDPDAIRSALEKQLSLSLVPFSTAVEMLNVQQVRPPSSD